VTRLAVSRTFEEVAELLWTGEFRSAREPWRARPAALAAGRAAQAALPAGTLPLERLQVIVPAMAATDPLRLQLDRSAVIAAGRNIIAGMVDCLPGEALSPPGGNPPVTPRTGGLPAPPYPPGPRGLSRGRVDRRAAVVQALRRKRAGPPRPGADARAVRGAGAAGRP